MQGAQLRAKANGKGKQDKATKIGKDEKRGKDDQKPMEDTSSKPTQEARQAAWADNPEEGSKGPAKGKQKDKEKVKEKGKGKTKDEGKGKGSKGGKITYKGGKFHGKGGKGEKGVKGKSEGSMYRVGGPNWGWEAPVSYYGW